ncbi:MHYT domain-containing protein [Caulobacter segnis]
MVCIAELFHHVPPLLADARSPGRRARAAWLLLTGPGRRLQRVWATHFIAMVAFTPRPEGRLQPRAGLPCCRPVIAALFVACALRRSASAARARRPATTSPEVFCWAWAWRRCTTPAHVGLRDPGPSWSGSSTRATVGLS